MFTFLLNYIYTRPLSPTGQKHIFSFIYFIISLSFLPNTSAVTGLMLLRNFGRRKKRGYGGFNDFYFPAALSSTATLL